jgi:hypothetical protein
VMLEEPSPRLETSPRPGVTSEEQERFVFEAYRDCVHSVTYFVQNSDRDPEELYSELLMYLPDWIQRGNLPVTDIVDRSPREDVFVNSLKDCLRTLVYGMREVGGSLFNASLQFGNSVFEVDVRALLRVEEELRKTGLCIEGIMPAVNLFGGLALATPDNLKGVGEKRALEECPSPSTPKLRKAEIPEILMELGDDCVLKVVYTFMQRAHDNLWMMEPSHPLTVDWEKVFRDLQEMKMNTEEALFHLGKLVDFVNRAEIESAGDV